jgi:hypothetical protein
MAINIPWFEPCQEKKRIKKKGKKKAKLKYKIIVE